MKKADEIQKETGRSGDEVSWLSWLPDFRGWFLSRKQALEHQYEERRRLAHKHKEAARHRHH